MTEENTDGNIEDIARSRGWAPKEEFKGDEDQWVPAEEFVEKGYGRAKELESENETLNKRLNDMSGQLDSLENHYKRQAEVDARRHAEEMESLKAERRKAVEEGDVEAFEDAEKKIEAKTVNGTSAFDNWRKDNKWFEDDAEMHVYAKQIAGFMEIKHGVDTPEMFSAVTEAVKEKFPNYFKNPNRARATVNEGNNTKLSGQKEGDYASLSREERAECDRCVASGRITQEDWVKAYNEYKD